MNPQRQRSRARLLGFGAAAAALLLLVWLAVGAAAGRTLAFDYAVRDAVHRAASPLLTAAMRWLTCLGAEVVLVPLGAVVAAGLVRARRHRAAILFAATLLGADASSELLKVVFHRARPAAFFGVVAPDSYAFPSGHSLAAMCFYGLLAALVAPRCRTAPGRAALCLAAAAIVAVVGFSRIYLGVHYPTDVLGGYTLAAVWLAAAWGVAGGQTAAARATRPAAYLGLSRRTCPSPGAGRTRPPTV
jgi:undecaprenyl-diphosphatase